MSQIAIQFDHVGKLYRLGTVGTGTLSHDLNRWWKTRVLHQEDPYLKIGETNDRSHRGHSDYVWALKDISFSVEQGDVVGIIGKNGAGKSTLLKLLSQITSPTTGAIRARGRIGSLLEVGTGFHPEMTGRENIYMNGAIMGMTRAEITRKLDEIIDFAGVARYVDTPVKRYSSGMTVRLGFAVAAFMEPEILVVDEVLAVGDAEFQKKAIGKMQDVSRGEGRTVLFVSHNMASIKKLCKHGILLENGFSKFTGDIEDVVDFYLSTTLGNSFRSFDDFASRPGTHEAFISGISMSCYGTHVSTITIGKQAEFTINIYSEKQIDVIFVGLSIWSRHEILISHVSTKFAYNGIIRLHKGQNTIRCTYLTLPLQVGNYYLNVALYHSSGGYIDQIEKALHFSVIEDDFYGTGRLPGKNKGCVLLHNDWQVIE